MSSSLSRSRWVVGAPHKPTGGRKLGVAVVLAASAALWLGITLTLCLLMR